jgi:hypothetical protein
MSKCTPILNATVPEPTTQTVFVVAMLVMFIRQRTRKP